MTSEFRAVQPCASSKRGLYRRFSSSFSVDRVFLVKFFKLENTHVQDHAQAFRLTLALKPDDTGVQHVQTVRTALFLLKNRDRQEHMVINWRRAKMWKKSESGRASLPGINIRVRP